MSKAKDRVKNEQAESVYVDAEELTDEGLESVAGGSTPCVPIPPLDDQTFLPKDIWKPKPSL